MIQEILTYLIVVSAFLYTGYKIFLVFIPKKIEKEKITGVMAIQGSGCDSCSCDCTIRDLGSSNHIKHIPFRNQ